MVKPQLNTTWVWYHDRLWTRIWILMRKRIFGEADTFSNLPFKWNMSLELIYYLSHLFKENIFFSVFAIFFHCPCQFIYTKKIKCSRSHFGRWGIRMKGAMFFRLYLWEPFSSWICFTAGCGSKMQIFHYVRICLHNRVTGCCIQYSRPATDFSIIVPGAPIHG